MAKRIVTKIGNIFCVEVKRKYKFYFQYIANDMTQLNSSVIRVFKRRYPLNANPKMDDIANDEVLFYAHTILRNGIEFGVWNKVGKSAILGLDGLEKAWFGQVLDFYWDENGWPVSCDPAENLKIWHVNQDMIKVGKFEKGKEFYVEDGIVFNPYSIVDRFMYGHYLGTRDIYYHVKRRPWPDVDTYCKLKVVETGDVGYVHFLGEKAVQQVIVTNEGKKYRFDTEHPKKGAYKLYDLDFGDMYWEYTNFITPEEFYSVWN